MYTLVARMSRNVTSLASIKNVLVYNYKIGFIHLDLFAFVCLLFDDLTTSDISFNVDIKISHTDMFTALMTILVMVEIEINTFQS